MSGKLEQHIIHQYDEELRCLHLHVCEMGQLVLGQLCLSLESLRTRNLELAKETIHREREVNWFEVSTDTEIFNLLAKRCPIASDLRTVMASSRIINTLERIGDEAAKLANFVVFLNTKEGGDPEQCPLDDVYKMGKMTVEIVRDAIAAHETLDEAKAREISVRQGDLTREFKNSLQGLMSRPREGGYNIGNSVNVSLMLKALEKIGNHAENIAESIVFEVSGLDTRREPHATGRDSHR